MAFPVDNVHCTSESFPASIDIPKLESLFGMSNSTTSSEMLLDRLNSCKVGAGCAARTPGYLTGKLVDGLDVFYRHAIRRLVERVGIKFSKATIDAHSKNTTIV